MTSDFCVTATPGELLPHQPPATLAAGSIEKTARHVIRHGRLSHAPAASYTGAAVVGGIFACLFKSWKRQLAV